MKTTRLPVMAALRIGAPSLLLLLALAAPAQPSSAASFTVNSTGDEPDVLLADPACETITGACTLRAAIQQANFVPGPDNIGFAIGSGPQTISPATPLDAITDSLTIDGTTQPGFSGAPIIELSGANAGTGANGLEIRASLTTIRGIVINRFTNHGVFVVDALNVTVAGNYLGTNLAGTAAAGNFTGVWVETGSTGNVLIGGGNAAARNVISGNGNGIVLSNSTGNRVQGNYIGTNAAGTAAVGNDGAGVAGNGIVASGDVLIGGKVFGADVRNVISGNRRAGIYMVGTSGAVIQANTIGPAASGGGNLPNGVGITSFGSNQALIGAPTPGENRENHIWANAGDGIEIPSSGSHIRVAHNLIGQNGGLGIDLGASGVLPNDPGDLDSGPNNGQNYPVINSVTNSGGGSMTASVSLNSQPNTAYDVRLYVSGLCDVSGHGEGFVDLHAATLTTDTSGNVTANLTVPSYNHGTVVTATATDPDGNTSEFSQCAQVNCSGPAGAWIVPAGDTDCDGFTDANENQVGTDPNSDCHADSTANNEPTPDRWPVDFNDNRIVNTADIGFYVPRLNSVSGQDPEYEIRYDLAHNGTINTTDIGRFVPYLNKTCQL